MKNIPSTFLDKIPADNPSRNSAVQPGHWLSLCLVALCLLSVCTSWAGLPRPWPAGERTLSRAELRDKIAGGWAGKAIGVCYGAKTEFWSPQRTIEGPLPWEPTMIQGCLEQDDLFTQMMFMKGLERHGLDATAEQIAEPFAAYPGGFCHANRRAWNNLRQGLKPPLSGDPRYNLHCDDIDFQIEADFIGFMNPGMPVEVRDYCDRIGHIVAHGDGVLGGLFVSTLCSGAFFENDTERLVEHAWRALPRRSLYAQVIADTLDGYRRWPGDWRMTWNAVERKWATTDLCIPFDPWNIDAKMNGAYIALALLYGHGDMARTLEIATRCGQDSDCNPSSAAGVLGVMKGFSGIPPVYTSGFKALDGKLFMATDYTFDKAVEQTYAFALQQIERNGGRLEGDLCHVRLQRPRPPCLEQSFDPALFAKYRSTYPDKLGWTFKGQWREDKGKNGGARMTGEGAGSEVTFAFDGTGVAIMGDMGTEGGLADVYIDGSLERTIDNWFPGPYDAGWTNGFQLYHIMNLKPGSHTVRLVLNGRKGAGLSGRDAGGTISQQLPPQQAQAEVTAATGTQGDAGKTDPTCRMWINGAIVYDRM